MASAVEVPAQHRLLFQTVSHSRREEGDQLEVVFPATGEHSLSSITAKQLCSAIESMWPKRTVVDVTYRGSILSSRAKLWDYIPDSKATDASHLKRFGLITRMKRLPPTMEITIMTLSQKSIPLQVNPLTTIDIMKEQIHIRGLTIPFYTSLPRFHLEQTLKFRTPSVICTTLLPMIVVSSFGAFSVLPSSMLFLGCVFVCWRMGDVRGVSD